MTDILEIKRRLTDRAQSVCERLLPEGRREGHEWVYDPGHGKIKVELRGAKAGVWSHFGGDDVGGDLIELWRWKTGRSLVECLDEIRDWLGLEKPSFTKPERQWKRPRAPRSRPPQGRVMDYLREERCIPPEILKLYEIGEDGDSIIFPFYDPDGELIMAKARKAGDGEKPKPTEAGCEKILFGWQAIDPNARDVTICEGEIDALALAGYGWPALSVPFGGGKGAKQDWIESDFERLERFETIYLAMDMDAEGRAAVEEIVPRLGNHRCRVVELPMKDADECRMAGIPKEKIDACFAAAKGMDPPALRRPIDFSAQVVNLFHPVPGQHVGYAIPYGKAGDRIRFRPAEVTVWSGASGSGKSQILSDCMVDWIWQGSRICCASLEMTPAQTLRRMVRQIVGTDRPTEDAIRRALDWVNGGLWLFDLVGKMSVEDVLQVFEYARRRYGCDQYVIDSLMRLGVETDDYNGQETTMFKVVDWAISTGVHVHFVAHSRKADVNQRGPQGTEDIKGAMELGANAFNVITVWRNRKLEDEIEAAPDVLKAELAKKPGVVLNVAKQRNGDWEGKIGLWFDQDSYRYRSSGDDQRFGRNYAARMVA